MSITINEERAKKIALDFIYDKLGCNMEPGKPVLGDTTIEAKTVPIWIVPIEADYPRTFEDVRNGGLQYIVLQLGMVGELEIDAETGEPVTTPHRHSIENAVLTELDRIRDRVEKMLVRSASAQLAKLVSLKHMLTPVHTLLTNLINDQVLYATKIQAGGFNPKYMQLLERSNFVKFDSQMQAYVPTPELNDVYSKFAKSGSSDAVTQTLEVAISEVILKDYHFVYDELKMRTLAPYVHIASSYYNNALSIDDLVSIRQDDLEEAWIRIYGENNVRKRMMLPEYLRQLSAPNIKIMESVGDRVWKGNAEIFNEMRKDNPLAGIVSG